MQIIFLATCFTGKIIISSSADFAEYGIFSPVDLYVCVFSICGVDVCLIQAELKSLSLKHVFGELS